MSYQTDAEPQGQDETRRAAPREIEIIAPCGQAWHHMKAMLFPFDLGKWFTLGFVAWLAFMFERGVQFNYPGGFGPRRGAGQPSPQQFLKDQFQQITGKISEDLSVVILIGGLIFLFATILFLVITYFRSRGLFMYLDCVYERKAAVVEPWHRARTPAWSYFLWKILLGLGVTVVAGIILAVSLLSIYAMAGGRLGDLDFTPGVIAVIVAGGGLLFIAALALALTQWCLKVLVAPVMYLRKCPGRQAWSHLRDLASGHVGAMILFFLMYGAIGFALGLAIVPMFCCCPCVMCILALPVLSETLLQPVLVWLRAYPFYFLAQFGPDYPAPTPESASPALPPPRQSATVVVACPACGQEHQVPGGQHGLYACVKCGTHFHV